MPNWCEGTLKVRGTFENLKQFVFDALIPIDGLGREQAKLQPTDNGELFFEISGIKYKLYLKGTRRHFIETDYINVFLEDKDEKSILLLPMKAAWDISAGALQKICAEFCVDMKIRAFESGLEFSRDIEIVNGEIVRDYMIEYNDYMWECPCPLLGG